MMPGILLIVGLLGLVCWEAQGQPSESTAFFQEPVKIHQISQFSDPDSQFSFDEILKLPKSKWKKVPTINFGYTGGSGWTLIELKSINHQAILMEMQTHFLNSVNLWLLDNSGSIIEVPSGFSYSTSDHNQLSHRYFLAEFPVEKNQFYKVLIRSSTTIGFPMKFRVKFWTHVGFLNYLRISEWGWALFGGVVLAIILFSFFCFIIHQKAIYIYFVAYLICLSLYATVNDGWGFLLNYSIKNYLNLIQVGHFLNLGICFFLLFSREFLVIPKEPQKWWLRVSPWWFYSAIAMCIILANQGYTLSDGVLIKVGYWMGIGLVISVVVLWVSYLIDATQRRFRPAWLLLGSQFFLILYFASNILLVNLNAVNFPPSDMLQLRLAILGQILIIALGWIYRQKIINDSQEKLSTLNVKQQKAVWEAERKCKELQIINLRKENELYEQRERLARDLHDGIGSQLTHIISRLDILSYPNSTYQKHLYRLRDFVGETNQNLRETIWILNQENIPCAEFTLRLRSYLCKLWEDEGYPRLIWECPNQRQNAIISPTVAMHMMRLTQEAIANVVKHAGANEVKIELKIDPPQLMLTIKDDGSGFDPEHSSNGFGMHNMRKRASEMGGNLDLQSGNSGTTIQIAVPVTA